VGGAVYEEKGRDIYDLLWYMERRVIPDFDYLKAKGIDLRDPGTLFDRLTLKMNDVSDNNLKQDLFPLFMNRTFIENWVGNWRESYLRLIERYTIRTVTELDRIMIDWDFHTGNYSFTYRYRTKDRSSVRITCIVSESWIIYGRDIAIDINESLSGRIQIVGLLSPKSKPSEKLKKYATLFNNKIEAYFKKTNKVILGEQIVTKVIRMTADNFNPREQILLNPSALLSCELEDVLK